MIEITIEVDANDADYNTQISQIEESDLEYIMPLIEAIKNFKPYTAIIDGMTWNHDNNYPYGDSCREDLGQLTPRDCYGMDEDMYEILEKCCPWCGDYGFHSIISIEVSPLIERERLL